MNEIKLDLCGLDPQSMEAMKDRLNSLLFDGVKTGVGPSEFYARCILTKRVLEAFVSEAQEFVIDYYKECRDELREPGKVELDGVELYYREVKKYNVGKYDEDGSYRATMRKIDELKKQIEQLKKVLKGKESAILLAHPKMQPNEVDYQLVLPKI